MSRKKSSPVMDKMLAYLADRIGIWVDIDEVARVVYGDEGRWSSTKMQAIMSRARRLRPDMIVESYNPRNAKGPDLKRMHGRWRMIRPGRDLASDGDTRLPVRAWTRK